MSFEDELKKIGLASRTRTERKFNLTAKKSPSSVVPNSTTEQAQALAAPVVSVSRASADAEKVQGPTHHREAEEKQSAFSRFLDRIGDVFELIHHGTVEL